MKLKKLFEFSIPQEVDSSRMTTFIKKSFREEGILFCKYTIIIFSNVYLGIIQFSSKSDWSLNFQKIDTISLIPEFHVFHNPEFF